jgi:hypothetical protein
MGGEKVFCDPLEGKFRPSENYRDLFLEFRSGSTRELGPKKNLAGIRCYVQCESPDTISESVIRLENLKAQAPPQEDEDDARGCVCGLQTPIGRVVGGIDVVMNEFPWQVALVVPGTRKPFCGGSLINNRFILTAAHCFLFGDMGAKDVEVVLHARILDFKINSEGKRIGALKALNTSWGERGSIQGPGYNHSKQTDEDEKSLRFRVKRVINHPMFSSDFDYDASLLEIHGRINFNNPFSPIPVCLPPLQQDLNSSYTNIKATVVGWGRGFEDAGSNNRLLQKVDVPVLDLSECNKTMSEALTRRMICAGYAEGGRDACTGDSGGPLIYKDKKGMYQQIGIVSWGEGCARANKPGLYSRVEDFIQWIQFETSQREVVWCKYWNYK